jgi:hypothetical protein
MLALVVRVRTDKDIARMWIAVYKPRHEDLLSKGPDKIVHNLLLAEPMRVHLLIISDLKSINPLRHHNPLGRVLRIHSRNVQFLSIYIAKPLLNC